MSAETIEEHVPCPFCGLLCDDLQVGIEGDKLALLANGCSTSISALARLGEMDPGEPRVEGRQAGLEEAVSVAARILSEARQPVFSGLATDVAGMRAVLELADRCGAVLDHMNSEANLRNLLVLQDSGWITTTLSEVKNRADLLLLVGTDAVTRFPRFFERLVWSRETLFGQETSRREVIYLGQAAPTDPGTSPDGRKPTVVQCDNARLGEVIGALRCLLAGRTLKTGEAGGVPLKTLAALVEKMRQARYGVIVWTAADLDFPHAELTVQSLCELIKELNRHTRFAGLPLGGSDGDLTASQVCTWQTGFPARVGFGSAALQYDPWHYSAPRMIERSEADALLWVSSLTENRVPPPGDVPTIVLGRAGLRLAYEPLVFIPVGIPGVDHAGHLFRADQVVLVPLRKLRETRLPSVAQVASAITRALPGSETPKDESACY